jgi:hypothetical protein
METICKRCDGAGGFCAECGAIDCDHADSFAECRACDGTGSIEDPGYETGVPEDAMVDIAFENELDFY